MVTARRLPVKAGIGLLFDLPEPLDITHQHHRHPHNMADKHPQGGDLFDMAKDGTKGLSPVLFILPTTPSLTPGSPWRRRKAKRHPLGCPT